MSNVRLFPVSRSRGRVQAIADVMDTDPEAANAAWRRECLTLARALFDQGVPDDRVDTELVLLAYAAQAVVDRRRSGRKAAESRRNSASKLRLVRSAQLDLFDRQEEPEAILQIERDLDASA